MPVFWFTAILLSYHSTQITFFFPSDPSLVSLFSKTVSLTGFTKCRGLRTRFKKSNARLSEYLDKSYLIPALKEEVLNLQRQHVGGSQMVCRSKD